MDRLEYVSPDIQLLIVPPAPLCVSGNNETYVVEEGYVW